jgi:hypothetical protein
MKWRASGSSTRKLECGPIKHALLFVEDALIITNPGIRIESINKTRLRLDEFDAVEPLLFSSGEVH